MSFSLAEKIIKQLPDIMQSRCDVWCDASGFEIYDPTQFKLTIQLQGDICTIDRLLVVKGNQAANMTQKIMHAVLAALKAANCKINVTDITPQSKISTTEQQRGFMVVRELYPIVMNQSDQPATSA